MRWRHTGFRHGLLALAMGLGCGPAADDDGATALSDDAGTGSAGTSGTTSQEAECSVLDQNAFVYETMLDAYFWNDVLPRDLDVAEFDGPQALLEHLISFQPLDQFSFLSVIEQENSFFQDGQYPGFGFSYAFEDDSGRATILFVHSDSPAARAGVARGQAIVSVDGMATADLGDAGLDAALGPSELGVTRTLQFESLDGTAFELTLEKEIVTIDPVPRSRILDTPTGPVGLVELTHFIGTADDALRASFGEFRDAGVQDVIIDLRYNGGGLVSTARVLGNLLGAETSEGEIFSRTLFNADNAALNSVEVFEREPSGVAVQRLVVIATGRTASASELVINAMEPHAEVTVVGSATRGKPVGQVGFDFCDQRLRPVSFEVVNSRGEGRYFDGIEADCEAPDDLSAVQGSDADPAVAAAVAFLAEGACPVPPPGFAPESAGGAKKGDSRRDIFLGSL